MERNPFLQLVAQLETAGGKKTIKGPNGEDSFNLYNIKQFNKKKPGFVAHDKAEGSRDAYRVYANYDEADADMLDLLRRKYPKAHAAAQKDFGPDTVLEFATGLKEGGYATDPAYVDKLVRLAGGKVRPTQPAPTAEVSTDPAAAVGSVVSAAVQNQTAQLQLNTQSADAYAPVTAQELAQEKIADETGVAEVIQTNFYDPRANPLWGLIERAQAPAADAEFSYYDAPDRAKWEAQTRTDEELQFLRENATSRDGVNWVLGELADRREKDKVYAAAGGTANLIGQLAVGLADPVGWAIGLGAGKVASMAVLAARVGRAGRAGILVGESVVGNVAWEAVQDSMGEVKTLDDYAVAGLFGAGFAVPFIPGAMREPGVQRVEAELERIAADIQTRASEGAVARRAEGVSPEQAAAQQAHTITSVVHEARDASPDDVIIPKELSDLQRAADEAVTQPAPERAKPVEREAPPPQTPDAAPAAAPAAPDTLEPPKVVRDASPKYRKAAVEFESATDKALYIVGGAGRKSKADEEVMAWLREQFPGVADADIRAEGALVRASVAELEGTGSKIRLPAAGFDAPKKPAVVGADQLTGAAKMTTREALTGAMTSPAAMSQASVRPLLARLLDLLPADLLDSPMVYIKKGLPGQYRADLRRITSPSAGGTPGTMSTTASGNEGAILAHEVVHAATVHVIKAVKDGAKGVTMQQKQAVQRLEELRQELIAELDRRGIPQQDAGARYATSNVEEFASQVFSDLETRKILAQMPGRGYAGDNALDRFYRVVMALLGYNPRTVPMDTALYDAMKATETLIRTQGDIPTGAGVFMAPSPQQRALTDLAFADRMYEHARSWVGRFGIDQTRLQTLAQQLTRKGSMVRDYVVSDGLKMASSKNPIVQMLSGLLVETTTGAAGRRGTAAIQKKLLAQRITGKSVNEYHTAYADFRKRHGGGHVEDHLRGDVKRQYDRAVYEEILRRRYNQDATQPVDGAVRAGADALERLYQRSLDVQKESSTLGSGLLPPDSRGYVPQQLNADALAKATAPELEMLADHLTDHWIAAYGWSRHFATEFSRMYLQRARQRAVGATSGVDFVALESPTSAVRDTLEQMRLESRSLDSRALAELDRVGAMPSNKRRLDVDLLGELPNGKRVLDYYVTDVERLTRGHANTVAGHAALASKGILGRRGVNNLLRAIENSPADELASPDEVAALQRVFGEFLGVPINGERRSELASGMSAVVRLQRLGGLAFTQLAETANAVHTLGLASAMKMLGSLPRQVMAVRKLAKLEEVVNPWLTPIERHQGFEFGMEGFRMVARLDPPDELLREYGKGSSLATRLLASGNHLQAQLSFFRGLHAAQHRATAEHIVKRALGYIQEGKVETTPMLQDMGISKQLATAIRADLPQALIRNERGDVVGFDIERLSSAKAREEFVQAIHRGTSQIIQDTFIGERGAWAHDDWAKVALQLRTFGLTAMEKQWGRTRAVNSNGPLHGYGYAAGVLAGQMAFAAMIYAARAQVYAAGREDREEYLERAFTPASMVQATLNYSAMSGLGGDAFDLVASLAGGWDDDMKETLGTRSFATGVGGLIPAAGSVDAALRIAQGKGDLHTALKQLPGSNLPWIAPILNLAKED